MEDTHAESMNNKHRQKGYGCLVSFQNEIAKYENRLVEAYFAER